MVKTIAQYGAFVERAHNVYSFAHIAIQEYYTALYIKEHPTVFSSLIINHVYDSRWEEVFLLIAEMLADADDFFNLWLNELDSLARQSERLIRLLKLVEMQISALQ